MQYHFIQTLMQKIISFHVLMLRPHGSHSQTSSIGGKLSDSINNEKRGNGTIDIEKFVSIYQHLRDFDLEGLNQLRRVVYLKWSARIAHIFHHSPFTFTTHHYMENRNLNYLLLYCAVQNSPKIKVTRN